MHHHLHRKLFGLGLVTLVALVSAPARAQSFTLEQVISSPFPSELKVSKRGDRIAWAFDAEGKRNIWIAEAPAFNARQLTHNDKDDGQELTDLLFSPNGNSIAYVRGGDANQAGEVPNPSSDPEGAKQEVWVVDVRTGRLTRIGAGSTPILSPAGDQVEFLRGGSVWTAPLLGGKESKMFAIRGTVTGPPQWAPDGSQLAFASSRSDHSFIAVYDKRANSFTFLAPSVDRDVSPRWSPDSRRIAFIRLFNVTDTFSNDRERQQPWALEVADAHSGNAKAIWRSGSADSDSYTGSSGDFWQWVAGDRILFSSEKEGWAHLYSISSGGGALTALTPGNFEVENATLSPDKSFIVFSANKDNIDRRHLWRVNVSGGAPEQITKGEGIEMAPLLFDNGRQIGFFHSTARDPYLPFTAAIDGSKQKSLAPQALPSAFPSAQLVPPEQVIFKAADGTEIHGQLFKPANASGKSPALVFMHGGPSRQMLLGWHYLYYYHNAYAMNQYLASHGYLVLSVNYRSGIGY